MARELKRRWLYAAGLVVIFIIMKQRRRRHKQDCIERARARAAARAVAKRKSTSAIPPKVPSKSGGGSKQMHAPHKSSASPVNLTIDVDHLVRQSPLGHLHPASKAIAEKVHDIGAIIGMDIGGTLVKVVYFERSKLLKPPVPLPPVTTAKSASHSAHQTATLAHVSAAAGTPGGSGFGSIGGKESKDAADDWTFAKDPVAVKSLETPRSFGATMRRSRSLTKLTDSADMESVLKRFYEFMESAEDMGVSSVKDDHLTYDSNILGGKLHFFNFETRHMDHAVEVISQTRINDNIKNLGCTGGGAFKFEDFFRQSLGVNVVPMDEMGCLIRGLQFCLANVVGECYTYRPKHENEEEDRVSGSLTAQDKLLGSTDTFRNMRMRRLSKSREKGDYEVKVRRSCEELISSYPALVVSIGSGVSIVKVDGPMKFERVSGSTIGGGTYWGLCRLLTSANSYDESLDMAVKGDNREVDMLVKDIYGRGYNKFQLAEDTIASSFGKITGIEEPKEAVRDEDIAKGLVNMITLNIGQVAYLNAKLCDTRRIYFVGNFLRKNPISAKYLSFSMSYWSSGEMEALFFEHEGYLGALGAFLMSGENEEP